MKPTTVKISVGTRERLRALGGTTYEETIVEALDALLAERFWAEAEAAAAWRQSPPPEERQVIESREAAVERALDRLG